MKNLQPRFRTRALALLALLMGTSGCLGNCTGPTDGGVVQFDGGSDPYSGPTPGSVIPEFPDVPTDGGEFLYDSGPLPEIECCDVTYRIDDIEADDVTGMVQGDHAVFGEGIPLVRESGEWRADVCIPLDASFNYWFVFTSVIEEETEEFYADGGFGTRVVEYTTTVQRANDDDTTYYNINDDPYHQQDALASCEAILDAGAPDAGPLDAGVDGGLIDVDAGPLDAGPLDAGPPDAGPFDAGPLDAGPFDAGAPDAGAPDAGPFDAGSPDAGPADAGPPDAGPPDAGAPDAGPPDCDYICDFGQGACISNTQLCDGVDDCQTGRDDDEDGAICGSCNANEFDCGGGTCLSNTSFCDGTPDCFAGFDEPPWCAGGNPPACQSPDFQCQDGFCLPEFFRCNGIPDCLAGDDEVGCP